jgi:phage FluMu gp28-like protein
VNTPLDILLPYQREWVDDAARFKIGMWARQTGKSMSTGCEAVRDCLRRKTTWVCLSAGERQALEWMRKARDWTEAFEFVLADYREDRDGGSEALLKAAEIQFPNGSRIIALPANPNTARGYSANLVLDEFAFHEQPDAIWRAIYPSISNPLKGQYALRIVSTPNGKANKFYDLWTKNAHYSRHLIDIYTAVERGLPLNVEELRAGLDDPEGWSQEFECQFIDESSILLPYELIAMCESQDAQEDWDWSRLDNPNPLYLGMDVGRKKDLTVLWLLEKMGDVAWTRGVKVMEKTPFHEQFELVARVLQHPCIKRACVDATGIGAMLAEELVRRFGSYRVEACQFTGAFKQEIFEPLRARFEERSLRVPESRVIREDLHGLQRMTTASGNIRYQAPHNEDGHCDRATALALALHAGRSAVNTGRIVAYARRGVSGMLGARRRGKGAFSLS